MTNHELIDSIADRLADELVTNAGEPASHKHVADIVEATAGSLADAPLQQFVPLLVEHEARNILRGEGLHRG